MIMAVGVLLVAALVPLGRGEFTRLADVRLHHTWLIATSLGIQIVIISVIPDVGPEGFHVAMHLFSYGLGGAFLVVNRHVTGLWIAAAGGAANFLVIAVNGGVMPASPRAQEIAGWADVEGQFNNSAVVADAKLWFLGDVFAIPAGIPFANVFSIGDVLLVLGAFVIIHSATGSHLVPARWRAVPVEDADAALTEAQPVS